MAWPSYAKFVMSGASESFDPSVDRTDMERGIAKQRIINSNVVPQIAGTILFQSAADIASFNTWYFTTVGRIGWFDFTHPRTGATVTARIVGGTLGELTPVAAKYAYATQSVTVEYVL